MAASSGAPGSLVAENINDEKEENNTIVDTELENLLDDALGDFDKINSQQKESKAELDAPTVNTAEFPADDPLQDPMFNQLYDSLYKMISEDSKSDDMGNNPILEEDTNLPPLTGNIVETIQKAFNSLNQNLEDIANPGISQEVMDMLSKMNMDDGDAEILPLVHGMMSNLLSKDVLYPCLKDISLKYPKWLSDNDGKLQEKELKTYREQHRLMMLIVDEYEAELPTDNEKVKKERFEKIVDLMQDMQQLGQPPKEIVGDMPKDFEFLPKMADPNLDPNQCCIT